MGSRTREKTVGELGPVLQRGFPPNGAFGLDFQVWRLSLPVLEPHQEALPTQPGSHQIREGCNGTNGLLLKRQACTQHCYQT